MLRAWRTYDFRTVFHLACKVGLSPEIIADSTGLPLALVLNIMNGNAKLSSDSNAPDSIASGFGMPDDIRGVLGITSAKPSAVASVPLKRATNAGQSEPEKSEAIKLRVDVGERIAELRNERRMTQEQLAERAGISSEMVRKLEQHARTPSLAMLDVVAKALDVPASTLLEPPLAKGEPGRRKWRLPDYLSAEILSRPDFITACETRDLGAVFGIATNEGFHRSHLARRCEMTVSQVSAYILGTRRAQDVNIFCRVSDGLRIPGAMFGIGRRHWETEETGEVAKDKLRTTKFGKRSVAQAKRELREQMSAAGMDYRQIAAEFARVYQLRPRSAWRDAYGWTLQETADKINAFRGDRGIDANAVCGMTTPHLSEYETWPGSGVSPAGRCPKPQLLAVLAALYGCEIHELLDLSDRKHYPKADLLVIDAGIQQPSRAGEVTVGPSVPSKTQSCATQDDSDYEEKIIWAARKPIQADATVVDPLTKMLAAQREAEDSLGAAPFIKPVVAQLATIENLVIDARGDSRPKIMDIAAQWAEYAGWLHISVGDASQARAWLDRACEWAIEAGNTTLAATSVSFKGHLAFLTGHVGPMLGLSQAAQRDRSIWIGQLAFDAHQEALAWALMGNADGARRKADEGAELATLTNDRFTERPPWAYYYTLPLYTAERGLVYRYLGRDDPAHNDTAIAILNDALDKMGENRAAEWAGEYIYHLAFAYLQAGSLELACSSAFEILQIVRSKESAQLKERVRALCMKLAKRWPSDPRVIELDQALHEAA